ncbi:probable serine/threonine-protein kinase DDB_G0282963 [Anopheles ziemanni]|uniref:probable serine/threonine-protein kinase DDB_G0282963 n=1 Tax=Anopheles coustani TaxID=139045 RepID=UPI0026586A5A|nr:probable serine/threonine-protein kinase DDB_G0282963 [Anopheles coustani]XP_058167466.1 probable serine/threonine-protein kinase DDB_G0282963 [Anopheles ziemanni]
MDIGMDRSGTDAGVATIGTLFQHIVNDMKNSSPLWEDFIAKATKLHACLRAAIQALAAYLDAFQKIADAATNSRGATKEIGTALTRVCLRHKAVESRMKTFTSAFMDCLIVPLQERLEDWRKQVTVIDKDHAKEYKRCRAELKKRSSDTLRLQKKAKKGQADNLHVLVESSMQDVTLRRCELEEVERKSLRAIMVEERSRYCTFVNMLQPVVHEECEVMSELSHLQEAMQLIAIVTKDPAQLPQASEELILESKANISLYPDSPGGSNSQGGCSNSLGSRKSSVCSISSINSSSSGSPGHHQFQRSLSQYSPAIRLKPGESSDSGFCSSPALTSQASTLASQSHAVSTWPPHTQDATSTTDRPHTISSAYEKGHQRPALTVYTFQSPETIAETQKSPANVACRPPLPVRCSSLERPLSTTSVKNANPNVPRQCPSPIPPHITKEHPQLQPTYVNMTELASMAASKNTNSNNNNSINNNTAGGSSNGGQHSNAGFPNQHQQQQQSSSTSGTSLLSHSQVYQTHHQQQQQPNSPVLSSASSLISPDSNATNPISSPDASACSTQTPQNTPQTGSPGTPNYSGGGAHMLGYRSSTPSSSIAGAVGGTLSCDPAAGGTTPTESNIDSSSNHTITIDDNDEHYNTSTSASANLTSSNTITNNTTTTTAASAAASSQSTNKPPSPPHTTTTTTTTTTSSSSPASAGGTKGVIDKDKDILKRTGSVLEKTSMFEQQINNNQTATPALLQQQHQQQLSVPTSPAARSNDPNALYGRRTNEEIYKSAGQLLLDRDADCIDKQTIEELNNLIGELDLFQREHESALLGHRHQHPHQRCANGLGSSDPEMIVANGVNNNHSAPLRHGSGSAGILDAEDGLQQQPPPQQNRLPSSISSSNSNLDEYLSNNQSGSVEETNGSMTNLAAKYSNHSALDGEYGVGTGQYNPYHQHQHAFGMLGSVGTSAGSTQGLDGIATTGFENPSFMMENYYSQNRSEVVVLRCKDTSRNSLNTAPDDLLTGSGLMQLNGSAINNGGEHGGSNQRLSSFRSTTSRPASPASMTSFFGITNAATSRSPTPSLSLPATANSSPAHQHHNHHHYVPNGGETNDLPSNVHASSAVGNHPAAPYDDRINRNKPAITPRPASLSGPTRVTRRASINTVKPPPPVRRSSSVTPSPSVGTNSTTTITNLAQQSLAYTSSESLPPPPAYLLDSAAGSSPSISGNVAGTVKALNEIRHTPASPGVLRRAQQQSNPPSTQGSPTQYTNLYGTLPSKHHSDHSSTASSSAAATQQAHCPPSQQQHHHHHPSTPNSFHATDNNKSLSNRSPKTNLQQPGGIYAQPKQLASMSSFRTSSPGPQKPNSSFLAQLNAKIAPNKPPPPAQQSSAAAYQQHPNQLHQQQAANNYVYTTAPSGNELIYQRSTPVHDPRAYNNNQQQQQQQQYYHSQQQQQQQPPQHPPREGKNLMYSASNQSLSQHSAHYQQQQQQQHHQQYYQSQYQQQQQQYQQQPQQQSSQYYYQQQQQQAQQKQQHSQQLPSYGHVLPPSGGASNSSSGSGYPTQNIYVSTNPFASSVQASQTAGASASGASSYSPSSFGKGTRHGVDDAGSGSASSGTSTPNRTNHHLRNNNGSAGSSNSAVGGGAQGGSGSTHNVLAKTSAGFLENLNARLAEQRLSGKAFAVRNLINSKALPDPRVCHESLMDQIKRGATLKRNRTINDRSAPKIH